MELENPNVEVPRDLISESPRAQKFVQDVISDLDGFKLYSNEEFLTVVGNVISGTGLDRQGESASVADLEALVSAAEEGAFFLRRKHDPLIHPIGRTIAAKMFQVPQTEKYFVVGIIGFYDASKLPSFASKGIDVSNLPHREASVDTPEQARALVEFNPHEIPPSTVVEMLKTAPPSVGLGEAIQSRKGVTSLATLQISASIWLLSKTPFGTKFQERLGEKAADASVAFLKWIWETVSEKLRELRCKETRLVISFKYKLTQNPKTDTEEIGGKLGQESGRGDKDDAQEGAYGRADRSGAAAGGSRSTRGRRLPQGGNQPSDILSLETEIYGSWGERVA
jgi:hypothetical protein